MGKIHILTSEVSNMIAAGEVVERPASVIKELVENSIDAGATLITVEIKKGGATYMRVTDNGVGMSAEDAQICFLRHATSKVRTSEDLDAIYTLGFRGEALSSIGAVAQVQLYTKRNDDEAGVCVSCSGGEILSSDDAGVPNGTSIVVENLFFNTPARRKFLKKDATEGGYIADIMTRFIFAHPEISFKLISDGKEKLFSAGDNVLENAVYTAYGRDYAKGIIPVSYESDGVCVTGVVGKGTLARPKRNYQSFFVNQRYITSKTAVAALENAYKNQIMIGKFPMAILNIEINPSNIDINVHPTKLEVKFSDEKAVYNAIYFGVKNALYALPNVPKIERGTEQTRDEKQKLNDFAKLVPELPSNMTKRPETSSYNPRINHFLQKPETASANNRDTKMSDNISVGKSQEIVRNQSSTDDKMQNNVFGGDAKNEFAKTDIFSDIKIGDTKTNSDANILYYSDEYMKQLEIITQMPMNVTLRSPEVENKGILPQKENGDAKKEETILCGDTKNKSDVQDNDVQENVFVDEYFEIVGQIFNSYIIAEKGNEMLIIDQHAAHERLKYEELKADISSKCFAVQMLIEPVVVNLTPSELGAYGECREMLEKIGFEIDEFGNDAIIVRGVPGEIELGEVEPVILELISQCEDMRTELISEKNERLLYTIACKAAVKANMRMGEQEMTSLVRNVLRLKNINTCPHGRPIIITMSKKELEKEFKRIV